MRGGVDEDVSEIDRRSEVIMENERDKIAEQADDNKTPDMPAGPLISALEILGLRMKDITDSVGKSVLFAQEFSDSIRLFFERWEHIAVKTQEIYSNIGVALNVFQQVLASFANVIADISIPSLSEERKQEILNSHLKWGQMGWTWFQDASINFYDTPPVDIRDASAKVKHLCSMQGMESLFNQLREQKINHEDLESAVFCFRNKQYKACALMLFGLIDAKLIRVQSRSKGKRKVGASAVRQLKTQFEENKDEQVFYTMLFCSNLFASLETIFAYGNDFKDEPDIINRNFVDHGMNHKRIRKRDCIQLFLVLNNLMYFLSEDIVLSAN